jgi:hypothetical protein
MLSNKIYDLLKWIVQLLLPGFATLYMGVADIWGLPYKEEIVATTLSIILFLNFVMGLSSAQYFKDLLASSELERFAKNLGPKQLDTLVKFVSEEKKTGMEVPTINKK